MKTLLWTCLLFVGVWCAGCKSLNQTIAGQNDLVAQIHQSYNAGNFDAIWEAAHSRLQGETEKQKFSQHLSVVHGKLGKIISTANRERRMSTVAATTKVFLVQQTVFEKGSGVETLTVQMDGDRAILVSYNIQSQLLKAP